MSLAVSINVNNSTNCTQESRADDKSTIKIAFPKKSEYILDLFPALLQSAPVGEEGKKRFIRDLGSAVKKSGFAVKLSDEGLKETFSRLSQIERIQFTAGLLLASECPDSRLFQDFIKALQPTIAVEPQPALQEKAKKLLLKPLEWNKQNEGSIEYRVSFLSPIEKIQFTTNLMLSILPDLEGKKIQKPDQTVRFSFHAGIKKLAKSAEESVGRKDSEKLEGFLSSLEAACDFRKDKLSKDAYEIAKKVIQIVRETKPKTPLQKIWHAATKGSILHAVDKNRLEGNAQENAKNSLIQNAFSGIRDGVMRFPQTLATALLLDQFAKNFITQTLTALNIENAPATVPFPDAFKLIIAGPVAEELWLRGIVQRDICGKFFKDKDISILVANTLFALIHLYNAGSIQSTAEAIILVSRILLQPSCSITYAETNSLVASTFHHMTINALSYGLRLLDS